jgi:hypothetical protein
VTLARVAFRSRHGVRCGSEARGAPGRAAPAQVGHGHKPIGITWHPMRDVLAWNCTGGCGSSWTGARLSIVARSIVGNAEVPQW